MSDCAPWIATTSGRRFDFSGPTPDMVDASDVVTASSRLFRFTGHGRRQPLDLNQHHLLVHEIASFLAVHEARAGDILQGALTHDAHEVYVGDVSRPLKVAMREAQGGRSTYDLIEQAAQLAVLSHFGTPLDIVQHPVLKLADNMALAWEARWLFGETWGLPLPPFVPHMLSPDDAAHRMFDVLTEYRAQAFDRSSRSTPSDDRGTT